MEEVNFDSAVRGYHVCNSVRKPSAGEKLNAGQERLLIRRLRISTTDFSADKPQP